MTNGPGNRPEALRVSTSGTNRKMFDVFPLTWTSPGPDVDVPAAEPELTDPEPAEPPPEALPVHDVSVLEPAAESSGSSSASERPAAGPAGAARAASESDEVRFGGVLLGLSGGQQLWQQRE